MLYIRCTCVPSSLCRAGTSIVFCTSNTTAKQFKQSNSQRSIRLGFVIVDCRVLCIPSFRVRGLHSYWWVSYCSCSGLDVCVCCVQPEKLGYIPFCIISLSQFSVITVAAKNEDDGTTAKCNCVVSSQWVSDWVSECSILFESDIA